MKSFPETVRALILRHKDANVVAREWIRWFDFKVYILLICGFRIRQIRSRSGVDRSQKSLDPFLRARRLEQTESSHKNSVSRAVVCLFAGVRFPPFLFFFLRLLDEVWTVSLPDKHLLQVRLLCNYYTAHDIVVLSHCNLVGQYNQNSYPTPEP